MCSPSFGDVQRSGPIAAPGPYPKIAAGSPRQVLGVYKEGPEALQAPGGAKETGKNVSIREEPGSRGDTQSLAVVTGGATHYPVWLSPSQQERMIADVREIVRAAPLFSPVAARGRPMSVRMTSAGRYGWYADRAGYRYETRHPSGVAWPAIPESVLDVWRACVNAEREPDCCLVNFYGAAARMGLHQDRDEGDFRWPVLSISLGDDARFRIGGVRRTDPTHSFWLRSGDVLVLGGAARLAFHGIDRIAFGTSMLLSQGGRVNLTLRVVD